MALVKTKADGGFGEESIKAVAYTILNLGDLYLEAQGKSGPFSNSFTMDLNRSSHFL